MALYLTISEGPTPSEAKPYLVTADQKLIRVVAKRLAEKLGGDTTSRLTPLRSKRLETPESGQ